MDKNAPRSVLDVPVQVSGDGSKVGVLTDEGEKDNEEYPTNAQIALALKQEDPAKQNGVTRPRLGADAADALPAPPALALSGNARLHSRYEEGRVLQQRRLIEARERDQKPWAASATKGGYTASDRITHLYEQGRVLQQRRLIESRKRGPKPRSAKSLPPRMMIPSDAESTFAPKLAADYTLPSEVRAAQ